MSASDPPPLSAFLHLDQVTSLPGAHADHRLTYGPDAAQFGDLYLPPGRGPHPVVVLLHGGCWRAQYDLAILEPLAGALRNEGLAVWSLEYRRLGNGGGWPQTFRDVAHGADFLRTLAPKFALDLSRVVTVGHSAGGHLALWLAARHRVPETSELHVADGLRVHGVVSLAGLADLVRGVELNLCRAACHELVGGMPVDMPERYAHASPRALLPLGVPHRHVVGDHDQIVPPSYVQAFVEAAVASGDDARIEVLPQAAHFEGIVPAGTAWPVVRRAVRAAMGVA